MALDCAKESINPIMIIKWIKNKIGFMKKHPYYFYPDGLLVFVGPQGSGKTLSAVNYVYRIMDMYPNCKLVTNVLLSDYPIVTFKEYKSSKKEMINELIRSGISEQKINHVLYEQYLKENRVFEFINNDDFARYNNGEFGVLFFIDEIQLYLNSLESKNINIDVVTQISQQRKQRKHIVCTSQVFGRMAKPLREQFSDVVVCNNYFGFIQRNRYVDRDSIDGEDSSETKIKGKVKKQFIWIHSPSMYKRYDTYRVIERGKFISGEKKKEGLYDSTSRLSGNY